jgi:hypothetical protein
MATQEVSVAVAQKGDPSTPSAASALMAPRVKMMRDVYGGWLSLRDAAETYLPKYEKESQARYDARLQSTFALNKLREAVDASSAKPFKTMVGLLNNTDPELDLWIKNIDLQGNHLHLFAHKYFNDAMLIGQGHILVDHPTTMNMPNLGAQKAAGVRPYFKHIKEDDVCAIYSEFVNGEVQVTHARIRGTRLVRTAEFKEVIYNQIYVLEVEVGQQQGIVQLWEQNAANGGEWTFIGETPLTLPRVPLVTMHAGDKEADFVTRPIFLDLAGKQIEHWQSSSDQRSILSAARFPMLAASGVELDPADESGFAIGPYKVLYSPEAAGRWYYVEPTGKAIASGQLDLAALELQMDMMALNPVQQTHRQYVPQNERDIQETRVHSVIHDLALSCRDALKSAVGLMGLWTNRDFSMVDVSLSSDFSNTSDKMAQANLLLSAFEKGALSPETWVSEANKLDVFSDGIDVAFEVAAIKARMAQLSGAVVASATTAMSEPEANDNAPAPDFPAGQNRPTRQI